MMTKCSLHLCQTLRQGSAEAVYRWSSVPLRQGTAGAGYHCAVRPHSEVAVAIDSLHTGKHPEGLSCSAWSNIDCQPEAIRAKRISVCSVIGVDQNPAGTLRVSCPWAKIWSDMFIVTKEILVAQKSWAKTHDAAPGFHIYGAQAFLEYACPCHTALVGMNF